MSLSIVSHNPETPNLVRSSQSERPFEPYRPMGPVKTLTFKEGEFLFKEGQVPQGLFFIQTGAVKVLVTRSLTRGRMHSPEYVSQVAGSGDLLGYKAVLHNGVHGESAKAMQPTEVHVYPMDAVQNIMKGSQSVERMIFSQMVHDLEIKEKNSQLHYLASVQERIAYQLLLLTNKFGLLQEDGVHLPLKLTRNELAQLAGTINESLSRHLTEFKNEGILELRGKEIIVKNKEALMQKSGNF